jgi:hypothetical protein
MNTKIVKRYEEQGTALLIAIFALMLISAVAISLVLISGTGSAIDSNYRNSTKAYYSALAGLEEGRGRLAPSNPDTILSTLPSPMTVSPTIKVQYIVNPASGETVSPTNLASSNRYADNEFANEWGIPVTNANVSVLTNITSDSTAAGLNGPMYKWIRITGVTEQSENVYVDGDGKLDNTYPIFYVNGNQYVDSPANAGLGGSQVYRVTALAVLPDNSRRMLQYDVVKNSLNLSLPGALTIDGPSLPASVLCASGSTCNSGGAYITGNEPVSGGPDALCAGGSTVPAIATSDATTLSNFTTGLSSNKTNITGTGADPSVSNASSSLANLTTVAQVEALVAQMTTLANGNVGPNCSTLNLGTAASPTITVVTNAGGSTCNLNSGTTGYGILVVTGGLQYVNVNSYQGIILMLGTAQFVSSSSKDTVFTGALFMAQDRNPSTGALLPGPGLGDTPVFNYHHGSASAKDPSIQYDSCVVNQVQSLAVSNFSLLSFREVLNQ